MTARVRFSSSATNITTFSIGLNQISQTVNYYTGTGLTNYVDNISLSGAAEIYPNKSWKGADYEYRSTYFKEYEFDMIPLSENVSKASFNKGNPLQLEIIFYGSKTSTEFKDIKRSRFNSDALFTTTMEPYAKSGGIVNSYQKGYSVQQYWPYQIGAD